ncbi:sigma-70 family RNA polymerase sigma factor [Neoroseomonas lacus]|uniref:RNA polymerase sigma factor SigJ n=1 Tax=Neoroseomonas lacus TaxID=287609 RepID=A0A917NI80_9PROT|nr:sigma-70 family RNA polymerase sigma factor [Neoroseomonas lacus]GGJ03123.1 RNA polymerase sigma factor SigJ [Neoroseomonas lacus]
MSGAAAGAEAFVALRPRLRALAYRFLGSVADAEDVVQSAWLRWEGVDRGAVEDAEGYLLRIVARLCLDELKSARRRRETYIGPWLPEPVVETDPLAGRAAAEEVSVALMLALERLSPLERAAFLLHDVFGSDFEDVAATLGRSPAAVRQLAARARTHVQEARPRFPVTPEEGQRIAGAFRAAMDTGDAAAFGRLLAEDAVLRTDGGGVVTAAINPVVGRDRVARFFAGLARKARMGRDHSPAWINGLPGYVTRFEDGSVQTTALEIEAGLIRAVYVVRNPEKLRSLHW